MKKTIEEKIEELDILQDAECSKIKISQLKKDMLRREQVFLERLIIDINKLKQNL